MSMQNLPKHISFTFKQAPQFVEEESPDRYIQGGFHPVRVGDIFNGYRVIRKLGAGAFSTVWLADDLK
jgi:hypothetical protein